MDFLKKHYEKIQRGLNITDDELKDVINLILKLNPRPGGNVGEINKAESYIIPDFFIINNAGKLELTLNSKNAPDLRISEGYREMLKEYDRGTKKDKRQKEAVLFISREEAPILTLYFPASAIHEEVLVSNEARSSAFNVNVRVSDLPGCNKPVFAKPFNSSDGLSSLTCGALK